MTMLKLISNISFTLLIGSSAQAVEFPFNTLGFDYQQDYPCTLIVISNQPSEDQADLGLWMTPPDPQHFVRYPAECMFEGVSKNQPTDLQVDCINKRMASGSWPPVTVFYDNEKKIFTSNNWGSELSIKGQNHESYLHSTIYKPIYEAICQN